MSLIKMNKQQLHDKIDYINKYIGQGNAATNSTLDPNANITHKNSATLRNELAKNELLQIHREMMCQKLTELFDEQLANEYIRQLDSHEIYCHDESGGSFSAYCASISLYPYIAKGLLNMDGITEAPKHLGSFCGGFVNLMTILANNVKGAVGAVELLTYIDHFARKDYGDNYLETNRRELEDWLQFLLYSLNQNLRGGVQSIFYNISIFDEEYFKAIFEGFVFPDGDIPNWESVSKLQSHFLNFYNSQRAVCKGSLTFPVITTCMLTEGGKIKDKEVLEYITRELADGNNFFVYTSENADSIASCCFDGEQKVLTKSSNGVNFMSFKDLSELNYKGYKSNFTVFHNGSWVKAKEVKLPSRKMYKITTVNNKEVLVSDNHIFPTIEGDKRADKLTTNDYLMFNYNQLDTFPEKDLGLTYEQGLVVGAFLGDGSMDRCNTINYSLNKNKLEYLKPYIEKVAKDMSGKEARLNCSIKDNLYACSIACKELREFIEYWANYTQGETYSQNKSLNMDCLLQSADFRKGILDGWYKTDGGNSNRHYSTSYELIERMEALCTSLGIPAVINKDERINEDRFVNEKTGKVYKNNHYVWCLRNYEFKNKRSMEGVYKFRNNSPYFKIKEIQEIKDYDKESVYCFEMENTEEPYFTLPNGIITHNCRLRNEMKTNTFSYTLGAGGISTGSINVITINMNRHIQQNISIEETVDKIHKYHVAYRNIIQEFIDAKMLPIYSEGYIHPSKQYLTIGINGLVESAEYLGMQIGYNEEYKQYVDSTLAMITRKNQEAKEKYGYMFNTEFVPAENLGHKNAMWDKKDGMKVNRDLYNSYFFRVEDTTLNILDKMKMHGTEFVKHLDGGSACHINLEEHPTQEQYKQLLNSAAKIGTNYIVFNIPATICNECGIRDKNYVSHCKHCGSDNLDRETRVIGYLKRVSNFSEARQKEAGRRVYNNVKTIGEIDV